MTRPACAPGRTRRHHGDLSDAHLGSDHQLDRPHDAPVVEGRAGRERHHLAAAGRLGEHHAVDRVVGGVENADREAVGMGLAGPDRPGHVDLERRLAPLVTAHADAVEPHVGEVVDGPEAQEEPAARMGVRRRMEVVPVPGDAMVAGQRALDDPGNARARGRRRRALPPLLRTPLVLAGRRPAASRRRSARRSTSRRPARPRRRDAAARARSTRPARAGAERRDGTWRESPGGQGTAITATACRPRADWTSPAGAQQPTSTVKLFPGRPETPRTPRRSSPSSAGGSDANDCPNESCARRLRTGGQSAASGWSGLPARAPWLRGCRVSMLNKRNGAQPAGGRPTLVSEARPPNRGQARRDRP